MMEAYNKAKYLVVFQTLRNVPVPDEYYKMQNLLLERLEGIDGFDARDSIRQEDGLGVTISYWEHLEAVQNWFTDEKHKEAQGLAKSTWYKSFKTVVCKIERQKSWSL